MGNRSRVGIERAIGEMRAGRPVRIASAETTVAVLAAEAIDPKVLARLASRADIECGLTIPALRARHLGIALEGDKPVYVPLVGLDDAEFERLVFGITPELPPFRPRPARPVEATALDLVRYAFFLPAAVMLRGDPGGLSGCVSVSTSEIENYGTVRAEEMTIVARAPVPLEESVETEFVIFNASDGLRDQVALLVGRPDLSRPVLTRIHSACLTGDLFASLKCDCGEQLRLAVCQISEAGGGLLLYLDQEGRGIGLRNKMRAYALQAQGFDTIDADAALGYGADERRYDLAGRMLECLGIRNVVLLTNNPSKIASLGRSNIRVSGHQRLMGRVNPHNCDYLETKASRSGHLLSDGAGP